MKNYSKKAEKDILRVRNILVERGINEEKKSIEGRRPYDLCPPQFYKKLQEDISLKRKSMEEKNIEKIEREEVINQKYKTNKNKS